jgi:putative ABC transport system substrate-binding protein
VLQKLEVIVTHSTPATQAMLRATTTIPIVSAAMGNPVGSGFVASLARPGLNLTGLSIVTTDTLPKRIDLLKLFLPKISRAAFLLNPANPDNLAQVRIFQAAVGQVGWKAVLMEARTPEEITQGFSKLAQAGAQAVLVSSDPLFILYRRQIVELAMKHRIPTMMTTREDAKAGALVSYGQNIADYYRRAAVYVDKILKGANPGELPIEQPTKIDLTINLKTAKVLGISVSKELMFRADEIFE